jgi:hypothetical protein
MTALLETPLPTGTEHHPHLRGAAARVLLGNWTGTSTVPSRSLYPHQWSWDSAFITIGLRHISPRRAQMELETLLSAQWADGRVPHIVFNPAVPLGAYFPSPDFWRSSTAGRAAGAPRGIETSGIVQPPVHALAAWLVHQADRAESARQGFLTRVYPRLAAWHRYLVDSRDLGSHGLAAVVHPWEPGLDNSPCWDAPLRRVRPAPESSFRRADLDHGAASDRPTDLDYGRYVRLATDYRDHGYQDARAPHDFAVEDPGFNSLLIASEYALADIAEAVGADPAGHRLRARRLTRALVERLWDPEAGVFAARDLNGAGLVPVRSVSGLFPLMLPGLPEGIAAALLRTAHGPHFGLGRVHMVPSYDLLGPEFDSSRYWRGPSWFNTAWIVHRGLVRYGADLAARALRASTLGAAHRTDFAEYVDPYTGQGRGARRFSWTAALALDLLSPLPGADAANAPGRGAGKGTGSRPYQTASGLRATAP